LTDGISVPRGVGFAFRCLYTYCPQCRM
jgi:hypothetical protein